MPLVINDARKLINRRVKIVFSDLETFGSLRGVSDSGTVLLLSPESGREIKLAGVESVEWAPFQCSLCHDDVDTIHDELCAPCYRREAEKRRNAGPHVTECEKCGKTPAFRNPKGVDNRDLLCIFCHAERGDLPKDYGIVTHSFPAASCVNADVDSPKHTWVKIKSGRWRCEGYGCNADRFTPPKWT